jgi:predicted nucleic acid-binding protein
VGLPNGSASRCVDDRRRATGGPRGTRPGQPRALAVKAFFDTSVLVPVFYGDHEHHADSLAAFLAQSRDDACCGAHSLAEVYSALTGMPGKFRVNADQAMLFIGSIEERLTIVSLSSDEYLAALRHWSASPITGGTVYDALLASCALKADADIIYSWNLRHYRQMGTDVLRRLKAPNDRS